MAGAANPAVATSAAGAMPTGGFGGKGGGQAAVASGPNFTAEGGSRAPQRGASAQPNVFQQSAGAYNAALAGTGAAAGFRPQMVRAPGVGTSFGYNPAAVSTQGVGTRFGYTPSQVAAPTAVGGIGTYMNPYTSEVIERTGADIARQAQIAQNTLGAQATQAGAFGGSRHGVAEGTMLGDYGRAFGDIAAQQRQAGFTTALGAAQQDAAANLQAALANQAAGARAAEFGQQTGLQAQLANQQAALQSALANQAAGARAAEFGQTAGLQAQGMNQQAAMQAALANQQADLHGAQFRLGAANQLSGLAGQGFGFGQQIGQQQMQQGMLQQALNQQLIDAARAQYGGFTGAPQQSLALPLAAVGQANMGQRSETKSQQPGLFDYLSLGASLAALSDRRLKTNIQPLGERNGVKLYSWDWNEEGKRIADPAQPTVGVMADELMQTHPHLVHRGADGYLRVDYSGLQI